MDRRPSLCTLAARGKLIGGSARVTRILIADDHMIVRLGTRLIIEAHSGWHVVAEADSGRDAIDKALATKPDVAVLDYSLPYMNGIEVTKRILARLPKTEILLFTMYDSERLFNELLQAGVHGYLLKSDARNTSSEPSKLYPCTGRSLRKPSPRFFSIRIAGGPSASVLRSPSGNAPSCN